MEFKSALESILFIVGKPISAERLAKTFAISKEEVLNLANDIAGHYRTNQSGLKLLIANDELQLVTSPENSSIVSQFIKDEFEENLTQASLETLAIIAYRGPISRAQIEEIRGVNSTYMLRALLIRGLIDRFENPSRKSSFLYRISIDFMRYLGLEKIEALPEYNKFKNVTENH